MFSIQIAMTATTAATAAARTRAYGIALPTSARTDFGADLGGRGVKAPAHTVTTVPGIPVWRPPTC